MASTALRIGSRGSKLALRQAEMLRERLVAAHPELAAPDAIEHVIIRTTGDRVTDRPLAEIGGKGLFIKELEEALKDCRIDLAVHSLKDVPAFLPDGFTLAAHLPRDDARDALIARHAVHAIAALPQGASVGTSSPRRQAQLLSLRPDLRIVALRGNVDTRLAKIADGAADATILALAGLKRLGRESEASAILSTDEILPAATQGIIAVEIRDDDSRRRGLLAAIDHRPTALCASAERALLETLDGDCRTPIAALATLDGNRIALDAMVLSPDGKRCPRIARATTTSRARDLGREIGVALLELAGPDSRHDERHTMKVLVTRAEGDAEPLAARLAERGYDSVIESLMTIRFRADTARGLAPFLDGVQAVLFTSANGVRAFAAATPRRDFPAFAVGDATATAARATGFGDVTSAGGAVEDLAALVIARLKPKAGALLHAAGSVTAGDLAGLLEAAGFALRRAVLYEAIESDAFTATTREAILEREIDAALFFSPRNAATFVRLAAGLEEGCKHMIAVALSGAVAEKLAPLAWRRVAVAGAPNEAALLAALEAALAMERTQ